MGSAGCMTKICPHRLAGLVCRAQGHGDGGDRFAADLNVASCPDSPESSAPLQLPNSRPVTVAWSIESSCGAKV